MRRRDVLRVGGQVGVAAFVAMVAGACRRSDRVEAGPPPAEMVQRPAAELAPTGSAYGALQGPDANGLRLPTGFASRVLARSGDPVGASGYAWHHWPDGAAVFPLPDGGWVYVSNSEVPAGFGGAGMLRFAADGSVVDARGLLSGTTMNCSGGATPWGTWLSCEEQERGRVFEVDPLGVAPPVERPALGRFVHEAAAVDPAGTVVYLTEDHPTGRFYRCKLSTPSSLQAGVLQVAQVGPGGVVDWLPVPDPSAASTPTRDQVPASTAFAGGEGVWHTAQGPVFTTKLDNRIWRYDLVTKVMSIVYDAATWPDPVLTGVDNLTGWPGGGLLVCEDAGDMQVVGLAPDGSLSPVLQVVGQPTSELTGIAADPRGERLYVASQRGTDGRGIVYEITGPWPYRQALRVPAEP